jgi:hypothetical protein
MRPPGLTRSSAKPTSEPALRCHRAAYEPRDRRGVAVASPHSCQDRFLALNTDRAAAAGIRPTIGAVGVSTAVSEMPNRQHRPVALRRGSRTRIDRAATQSSRLRTMAPSEVARAREWRMLTSPVSGVDAVRPARVGGTSVLSTSACSPPRRRGRRKLASSAPWSARKRAAQGARVRACARACVRAENSLRVRSCTVAVCSAYICVFAWCVYARECLCA